MTEIKLFDVVCRKCLEAGIPLNEITTNLVVNFNKSYYTIMCLRSDCGAYEVFDELGNQIVIPEGKEIDGKVEKEKQVN